MTERLPDIAAIEAAARRIAVHAAPTPVLRARTLDDLAGAALAFKCEHLQRAGAFKFRGACNAVWSLDEDAAARGVVTHSSGNHGAALALAAATRGIRAHVVVPDDAVRAKVAAIEAYGASVHRCAPTLAARDAGAAAIVARTGASLVHPYADARVIAGQGTAVLELLEHAPDLDTIVVPIGGGGLAAGTAIAARARGVNEVYVAEPAGAADAHASLAAGRRVVDIVPRTVCDGLRATIGEPNFDALRTHGVRALTVDDADTVQAMRLLWSRMKQVVEPSSAIALAAVLGHRDLFAGRRVGIVLTGGNVDLDALPWQAPPRRQPGREP